MFVNQSMCIVKQKPIKFSPVVQNINTYKNWRKIETNTRRTSNWEKVSHKVTLETVWFHRASDKAYSWKRNWSNCKLEKKTNDNFFVHFWVCVNVKSNWMCAFLLLLNLCKTNTHFTHGFLSISLEKKFIVFVNEIISWKNMWFGKREIPWKPLKKCCHKFQ